MDRKHSGSTRHILFIIFIYNTTIRIGFRLRIINLARCLAFGEDNNRFLGHRFGFRRKLVAGLETLSGDMTHFSTLRTRLGRTPSPDGGVMVTPAFKDASSAFRISISESADVEATSVVEV
jgi:hypothetical protein